MEIIYLPSYNYILIISELTGKYSDDAVIFILFVLDDLLFPHFQNCSIEHQLFYHIFYMFLLLTFVDKL